MIVYHMTGRSQAASIQREGFRDHPRLLGGLLLEGVWWSDVPYDQINMMGGLEVCFRIDIPDEIFVAYEIEQLEADEGFREACIPAALVNQYPLTVVAV